MTPAATAILASLNEVFAPMDAEVLASSLVWAKGRCEALAAFKASEEVAAKRKTKDFTWWYYPQMFTICGGKTWFQVFNGGFTPRVEEFVTKNCAATVEARNVKIAKKLEAAGVTSLTETTYTQTRDGFNGFFVVETNAGTKKVTVQTVRAGGYNIQCLHLRVLVKVK